MKACFKAFYLQTDFSTAVFTPCGLKFLIFKSGHFLTLSDKEFMSKLSPKEESITLENLLDFIKVGRCVKRAIFGHLVQVLAAAAASKRCLWTHQRTTLWMCCVLYYAVALGIVQTHSSKVTLDLRQNHGSYLFLA